MLNSRVYKPLTLTDVMALNWDSIPEQPNIEPEEWKPPVFDRRPITKEEYLERIQEFRYDSNFTRVPLATWCLEEFPEFAETRHQLSVLQAEYAEKVEKARLIGDMKLEEEALKEKIAKMKKLAKKNKALRKAKARLEELERKRAELEEEMSDEEIDLTMDEKVGVIQPQFSGQNIDRETNVELEHTNPLQSDCSVGGGAGGEAEQKADY
jgi:hypothetical protein